MKKSNVVTIVMLLLLVCVGWIVQINGMLGSDRAFRESVETAEEYLQKGLYQKAIEKYESALAIREDQAIREDYLSVYRKAYDDGVATANHYGKALQATCEAYPSETAYWETLLGFYIETESYTAAYDAYIKCEKSGVSSETITELSNDIVYYFTVSRKLYTSFCRAPSGYYTINDMYAWGVMDPSGERIVECDYTYISPYSMSNMAAYVSSKGTRLIDGDGVVQAIISGEIAEAGAYGDDLLSVKTDDGMWTYLCCSTGDMMETAYEKAANYTDGVAAVKKDGAWKLIDTKGNAVCKRSFDDVKLHGNGDYIYKDVMIASVNGEYGIYNNQGELVQELDCKDADIYLGGYIAVQDANGKWGYVDAEGNVVIRPQYDAAKSFSNGLAAVLVGDNWGFIDTNGMIVIDPQFREADYFTAKGVCFVSMAEGQYYLIKLRFVED